MLGLGGGPPLALWLQGRDISHKQFRATLLTLFFLMNLPRIPILINGNIIGEQEFFYFLYILPLFIVSIIIGHKFASKISANKFSWLIRTIMALAGIMLLVKALI
jgi:uncharacterized membrane protein YfcA